MKRSTALLVAVAVAALAATAAGADLTVTPATVSDNPGTVTIAWKGAVTGDMPPNPASHIAIYSPCDNFGELGVYPLKEWDGFNEGVGNMTIKISNTRADYCWRLFVGVDFKSNDTILAATSNRVVFENAVTRPEYQRLAVGDSPTEMRVLWQSGTTTASEVKWGTSPGTYTETAAAAIYTYKRTDMCNAPANETEFFRDPGYVHDALMTGLSPSTKYYYVVGNTADGWTAEESFTAAPATAASSGFNAVLYGDLGVDLPYVPHFSPSHDNQQPSADTIAQAVAVDPDMVLHNGDISYARGFAVEWDYFHSQTQPLASNRPYMVSIGNHEYDYLAQAFRPSWSNYGSDSGGECGVPYVTRFHMPEGAPGSLRNMYYSFDYGNTHFVVMSTETDWLTNSTQFAFLEADLKAVDRSATPWLIVAGHRPTYSTNAGQGQNQQRMHFLATMEPLLIKYKVDLYLGAHVHAYERTCPISNYVCTPDMPVHMVIGMAGNTYQPNWEQTYSHTIGEPRWSLFRSLSFGFVTMKTTATTLTINYLTNSDGGGIHDSMTIQKM